MRKQLFLVDDEGHFSRRLTVLLVLEQVLDKGAIVQAGKYEDLLQAGTNFQSLVNAHNEAIDGMDVQEHSEGV